MKKMRGILAFLLAVTMVLSPMTVLAEETNTVTAEERLQESENAIGNEEETIQENPEAATDNPVPEVQADTTHTMDENTVNEELDKSTVNPDESIVSEEQEKSTVAADQTVEKEETADEVKESAKPTWVKEDIGWKLQKPEVKEGEIAYYTKADGIVVISDSKYYFDEQGVLITGFAELSGVEGYADGKYYFKEIDKETDTPENSDIGKMQVSTSFEKDEKSYEIDEQGIVTEKEIIKDEQTEEAITLEALQDEAMTFYAGQSYTDSLIGSGSRKVYRIVITRPGILKINLRFYMRGIHTQLYDVNGNTLSSGSYSWNSNIEQGNKDYTYPLEKGTYYWVVSRNYDGKFTMSSTYEDINSGEQEPNNTIANAQNWGYSGQTINGLLGMSNDKDTYAIDLSQSKELVIKLKSFSSYMYIAIYDKDGNREKDYSNYWNSNIGYGIMERSMFLSAGRHYIQVTGELGKYNLTLTSTAISHPDGWAAENGGTYYYRGGQRVTGWQTISGNQYYFSRSQSSPGKMAIGFTQIGGKYYYFSGASYRKGVMLTGLTKVGNDTYYFQSWGADRGATYSGWIIINGQRYYFNQQGKMVKGWNKISNNMYYFSRTSGHLYTGFCSIDGKKYYFSKAAGTIGVRKTGLTKIGSTYYYFEPHGITGSKRIGNNSWYFVDGKFQYKY